MNLELCTNIDVETYIMLFQEKNGNIEVDRRRGRKGNGHLECPSSST
jgi:hypothetical protein